jgi:hypothetical protein
MPTPSAALQAGGAQAQTVPAPAFVSRAEPCLMAAHSLQWKAETLRRNHS